MTSVVSARRVDRVDQTRPGASAAGMINGEDNDLNIEVAETDDPTNYRLANYG